MSETSSALAVRVRWGAARVASQVLEPGGAQQFSVGPGQDDVAARGGRVGFRVVGGGIELSFTEGLRGEVVRNGEVPLSLSEVVLRGLAEEKDGGWVVPLAALDTTRVRLGALDVEAFPVRAPARVPSGAGQWDFLFLNTLLGAFALALFFGLSAFLRDDEAFDDAGPPLRADAARMRRVLAQVPPVIPRVTKVEKDAVKEQPKSQRAEAGKPKPSPSPPRQGRAAPPLDVRTMLAAALGPGTGQVLAGGGLGAELSQAMGRVVGASQGLGGWTARGTGTGGDVGGPLGIGRLGVPHGAPGAHEPGLGAKEKADPMLPDADPPVICGGASGSGCIDKEMLRRVIRSHLGQVRYCYESQLTSSPNLAGKVGLKFHVAADGSVDAAEVASSTVGRNELGSCLVGRVRTWRFPKAPAGYVVAYPFLFQPSGGGR